MDLEVGVKEPELTASITSCSESAQDENSYEDCISVIYSDPEISAILEN